MQFFLQSSALAFAESSSFLFSEDIVNGLTRKIAEDLFDVLREIAKQDLLTWLENIKRVNEGKACVDLEDYQDAISLFKKVIRTEPQHYEAWLLKGICHLFLDELEQAVRSFDQTLQRRKTYQAYHYKAITQIRLQYFDAALESLGEAILLNPRVSELWFDKARILEKVGKYSEALEAYNQAATIKPKNQQARTYHDILKASIENHFQETVEILTGKASVLIENSRLEDAIGYVNKAIEMDSDNPKAWILRGDILRLSHEYENAISSYQRSIGIDSQLSQAFLGMGLSFYFLKKNELARRALKEAIVLDKNSHEAYFYLGLSSYQLKYWLKADEAFTAFCQLQPDDIRGPLHRGHNYRKHGDFKRKKNIDDWKDNFYNALICYWEVLGKDPDNLQALTCVANIHFVLGNKNFSLSSYYKILELNPNDQAARLKVRELERRQEQERIEHEIEIERKNEQEKQEKERRKREQERLARRQQELDHERVRRELEAMRKKSKPKWFRLF
jgi:tetratricopeptide (TPR) repeat protein